MKNRFEHQNYSLVPNQDSFELVREPKLRPSGSVDFESAQNFAARSLRTRGISRIILVHGTVVGTDALGWYSHWQRAAPSLATKLKSTYKSIAERLAGDQGNFTSKYESVLRESINKVATNSSSPSEIEVERFDWTGENHHLGRANAAVVLAERLIQLAQAGEGRILLIGHSHAGNVFAILTQLLSQSKKPSSKSALKRFFNAGQCFSRHSGRIDINAWNSLEASLKQTSFSKPLIDIATMGTPVRYGWNLNACENLLHFVNHRPVETVEPFRGLVPANPQEFLNAISGKYGDYVQQTCLAQTDLPPAIWSWNAWNANGKLRDLLESTEPSKSRGVGLSQGVRVAQSGKTLLVDYADADPQATDVAGHAVYTKIDWMAFHMQEIAKRFYQPIEL